MKKVIITSSYEETQRLAEEFVNINNNCRIFALYGDLGSGKTTFVQGLARGFGIDKKIISPTFIIMRKYHINLKSQNFKTFFHVDLYRIGSEKDLGEIGLVDVIEDETNIFAIEWPEKAERFLPDNVIRLNFEYLDDDRRKITMLL